MLKLPDVETLSGSGSRRPRLGSGIRIIDKPLKTITAIAIVAVITDVVGSPEIITIISGFRNKTTVISLVYFLNYADMAITGKDTVSITGDSAKRRRGSSRPVIGVIIPVLSVSG